MAYQHVTNADLPNLQPGCTLECQCEQPLTIKILGVIRDGLNTTIEFAWLDEDYAEAHHMRYIRDVCSASSHLVLTKGRLKGRCIFSRET